MSQTLKYPLTDSALRWLEDIFAERFGHSWHLTFEKRGLCLKLLGTESVIVFDTHNDKFTQANSNQPCSWWDAEKEGWQSVLGGAIPAPCKDFLPSPLIETLENFQVIHYDIPGLTYWMLARVEEIGRKDLDQHQRFPASSSHAYQHDYLDRPLVDEWLCILRQVIQRQWPTLKFKRHEFKMRVSHDVDQPSLYAFRPWKTIGRIVGADLLKHRKLKSLYLAPFVKVATRDRLLDIDPINTFDWLMDLSEANNMKSAFYFMCGRTQANRDADYELESPVIRNLLKRINLRGHEVGLHPSYNTFRNPHALAQEAQRLKLVCAEEDIKQSEWGGRMHYLRWDQTITLNAWASAGMDYDSTLGYADHAGFRCGTCYEYPAFDAFRQKQINLRIRPLITMECTVIDNTYMGFGISEKAKREFLKLKERCYLVNGCFTLLWHNSYFLEGNTKEMYKSILVSKYNQ